MTGPTVDFWQERFESGSTPWDRGAANPQLLHWIDDGSIGPHDHVVVPGCGRGWEVAALAQRAIRVTGLDYAPAAVAACQRILQEHVPQERALQATLEQADVLEWTPRVPVDVVYEQTCLCALHPDHWQRYAAQLHAWIKPGGRLLAMFVQAAAEEAGQGFLKGPPYHCDIHAMRALFPQPQWEWPKPPYPRHASGGPIAAELAVVLTRR